MNQSKHPSFDKIIFDFFRKSNESGEMSPKNFKIILILNCLQFISLNLDITFWGSNVNFQSDLLKVLSACLKPFQLHITQYFPNYQLIVFSFWLLLVIIATSIYFILWMGNNLLLQKYLHVYNSFFILLICPSVQSFFSNIQQSYSANSVVRIVFASLGLLLIAMHSFVNIYIVNEASFNKKNRMNRMISTTDILHHLLIILPIASGIFLRNFSFAFYLSAMFQLMFLLLLILNYSVNIVYFDVQISMFRLKILLFKLFFLLTEIFSFIVQRNTAVSIVLMVSFSMIIGHNLVQQTLYSFLFESKNFRFKNYSNSEEKFFLLNFKKCFMIFSYFYYHDKDKDFDTYDNLAKTIPLEFLAIVQSNLGKENCEKQKDFQECIRNHIIELFESVKFVRGNQFFFFQLFMPFLLLSPVKIFKAIRLVEKIQKKKESFSVFDKLVFRHFLESIKLLFNSFEKTSDVITLDENSLISRTTNFFPHKFYQFNHNFEKLSKEIDHYTKLLVSFIDNMKSESPNIQIMEKKGIELLKTQKKIDKSFEIGNENPIFLYKYSMYLQTFRPDMKKEILKLVKKFNSLEFLEKTTLKENNHIYDFIIENLTFSTASSFLYVSAGVENLGKIKKIDSTLINLLEYKEKVELIGSNISIVIPDIIAENHQGYLETYLKTGQSNFSFREQTVQMKKKNGELVNIHLTIKPHFMEGENNLIFFCHLKSFIERKVSSVVILDKYGYIDSYGGKIREIFGPLFKIHGRKFYIQMFLPMLNSFFIDNIEKENIEEFRRESDDLVSFFYVMEKFSYTVDKIKGDPSMIRQCLTKIRDSFDNAECGAEKFRIDFDLKVQKYKNLNFYILQIHSMAFLKHQNKVQRRKAEKTRKEGELFMTAIPKMVVRSLYNIKNKKAIAVKEKRAKSLNLKKTSINVVYMSRIKSENRIYIPRKSISDDGKNPYGEIKQKTEKHKDIDDTEGQKFFGENKRFIFAESSHHEEEEKEEMQSRPSVSSVQSTLGKDLKENFFTAIKINSVPSCYTRYLYFHFLLFILAIVSLIFLSQMLSTTIVTINTGFNQTFLIENFKIRFLKTLFYAHKYKKFNSAFELSKINDQGNKMAVDIVQLLYPPFNKINNQYMDIFFPNRTEKFSSTDAVNFFNAISIDVVKHPYKVDLIIQNALNIFQLLEGIANILEILLDLITAVEKNLTIYSAAIASIATLVVLFQIFNLTLCYFFINENYRKMLTIPNEELNKFLATTDSYKEDEQKELIRTKKLKPMKSIKTDTKSHTKLKFSLNVKTHHKQKRPIDLIQFPILKSLLIALISLCIFSCFVVIILYKASFLDSSLVNFLKGEVHFQRSKAFNYMYIIRRVNKLYLNNSYHYNDMETTEMFEVVRNGVNIIISHANDFTGSDKTAYLAGINESICTAKMHTFPLTSNLTSCPKLSSKQYTKGMVGTLSYANLLFEQDLAGVFNLNVQTNIDLLDYTIILYDRKLRDVAQNTLNMISNNLNKQSADSTSLNIVFLIITTSFLLGFYFFYLKRSLKTRLLNSKVVYQVLPSRVLFKSAAIKSYLRRIMDQKIRKN